MSTATRVPFDPELAEGYDGFKQEYECEPLVAETIASYRARFHEKDPTIEDMVDGLPVTVEDRLVPGPPGAPDVLLSILRPEGGVRTPAGLYGIHGGGMVLGDRAGGVEMVLPYVIEYGCVGVTVEYRLAPENPAPAALEDCYAGLAWMMDSAAELGLDAGRIVVVGASAGGGLAAGTVLLARDRGLAMPAGQSLICPMIDDRDATTSSRQFHEAGVWPGTFNRTGWEALLGADRRGTDDVSPYVAPARMQDLSGLPPAYIEVGAAEVFRDEGVDYASRIWQVGGQAELHVWAGGYHGYSGVCPSARVSRATRQVRHNWLCRVLDLPVSTLGGPA